MSLLDSAFEDFVIVNKTLIPDGYGGVITTWIDGAYIRGALAYANSGAEKIAQALGASLTYTLTVRKSIDLDFHTVVRRVSDGKTFRVISDSDDLKTPQSAGLNMRNYDVEAFIIPSGGGSGE